MSMSAADMQALSEMYDSAGSLKKQEIENQFKLGSAQLKNSMKIAQLESGDRRANIEAQREASRAQIEQARQEMERIGIPEMEIKKYVAEKTYEVAQNEIALKREIAQMENGQAQAQLAKDIREMEEISIPRIQIERYVAEKNAEMAQLSYGLDRDKFAEEQRQFGLSFEEGKRQYDQTHAEGARQFNVGATGYVTTPGTLTIQQQARYDELQKLQAATLAQGGLAGTYGQYAADELQQLEDIRTGAAAGPGGGGQQTTLAREQFQQTQLEQARRYGLDVSKFGAELASTPDTYFQARRFQGVDVPRLMGGAGAATAGPMGGPTPGVATMGSYLAGQDPYATPYGGPSAGAGQPAAPGTLGLPGTPEDDRAKQVAKIAALSPPSPYDGLNEQDTSALKLMESIYKRGGHQIAGGEYERLQASGRLGYLQSAGRMLGYDPKEFESQYQAYRPAQQSASLAG